MTIKEVSIKLDITPDTLRFYEKEGIIGPIQKTSGGIRNYTEHDLARIQFIKCMRGADVSIQTLKLYVTLYDQGDSTKVQRREILEKERQNLILKIEQMNKGLEKLNYKIKMYDQGELENILKKD